MNLLYANDRAGQYPRSWYAATTPPLAPFPALKGETRADVCVVGGGYTGISTALHLARAGRKVVLLEAHRVGFGASGRNGGQVLGGQRLDQIALERMVGTDDAAKLWQLALASVQIVRDLVAEGEIDCDLQPGALHTDWWDDEAAETRAYAEHLAERYDYTELEILDRAALGQVLHTDVYAGGLLDHGSAHLNPLAYALGLARMTAAVDVTIHETSRVHRAAPGLVTTDKGRVIADQVVLACNGYLGRLQGQTAARVMPINNFIVATEPLPEGAALHKRVCVADSKFVVNYYRTTPDNRLLFGGGETYGYRFPLDIAALVRKPLAQTFPHLSDVNITHAWGGTLAITMNRMPVFAAPEPGLWTASGYSGHGVAMATLAGKMIADAIQGDSASFDLMARVPSPRFPGGTALRWPLLAMAMRWFALRDKLGI
ncbi:FAD-binding oxidoreductase [Fontisubflavum oceani]|uniref:NAD(P)/FAD-dependent oxidoreductase n=1 Tax=Fontisubflavum oceani TaxID=2978973 RepID=UPI0025B5D660|nr:FAD-binding oxidoreductase [Fontisubflavum oceani]WJY23280.1 FAD-binding oxidoreductase [Fontisubflavum oceani]